MKIINYITGDIAAAVLDDEKRDPVNKPIPFAHKAVSEHTNAFLIKNSYFKVGFLI